MTFITTYILFTNIILYLVIFSTEFLSLFSPVSEKTEFSEHFLGKQLVVIEVNVVKVELILSFAAVIPV